MHAVVAAACVTSLLCARPLAGQTGAPVAKSSTQPTGAAELPRLAQQIYDQTMSPFCPSLLLANCQSPQAETLRRAIASRVLAGDSREAIDADLLATYGEVVRAVPPRTGFGFFAWWVPAVAVLAAGAGVTLWVRKSAGGALGHEPADATLRWNATEAHYARGQSDLTERTVDATSTTASEVAATASDEEMATIERLVRAR